MGGRVDIILMSVKFGDDAISGLDFSFTGDVPLNRLDFKHNYPSATGRNTLALWDTGYEENSLPK